MANKYSIHREFGSNGLNNLINLFFSTCISFFASLNITFFISSDTNVFQSNLLKRELLGYLIIVYNHCGINNENCYDFVYFHLVSV